jgi:hypothetical protein
MSSRGSLKSETVKCSITTTEPLSERLFSGIKIFAIRPANVSLSPAPVWHKYLGMKDKIKKKLSTYSCSIREENP